MDFRTKIARDISIEEAVSFLKNFPLTDKLVRSCLPAWPIGPYGADVSYMIALTKWRSMDEQNVLSKDVHPVKHVGIVASTHAITIYPYMMQYKNHGTLITEPVQRGYVLALDAAPRVIVQAHVSDVMAYLYTEPSKTDAQSEAVDLKPNFLDTKISPKSLMPSATNTIIRPETWMKGKASTNRDAIFATIKQPIQLIAAQDTISESMTSVNALRYKIRVTKLQKVKTAFEGYSKIVDGEHHVHTLSPFQPPLPNYPTWDTAYRWLAANRSHRGEDKNWISPLTSGYYWASIPASLNKYMWHTADILHMLRLRKLPAVFFAYKPPAPVTFSLVHSGIIVYVQTTGVADEIVTEIRDQYEVVVPNVYQVRHIPDKVNLLVILNPTIFPKPVVLKKDLNYGSVTKGFELLLETVTQVSQPIFVHGFLSPALCEFITKNQLFRLEPSLHAHAGSVIVTTRYQGEMSQPDEWFRRRMCHANGIKTWFPISRYRMLEHDYAQGFQNLALAAGLILSLAPKMRVSTSIYDDAIIEEQVELPNEIPEVANKVRQFYLDLGIDVKPVVVEPVPLVIVPPRAEAREPEAQVVVAAMALPPPVVKPEEDFDDLYEDAG